MSDPSTTLVIPVLRLADRATLDWLASAVGFEISDITPDDHGGLHHAKLWWGRDCIMASTSPSEGEHVGAAAIYLTLATDAAVDDAFERATAAGAEAVRPPVDQPYGGRGATIRDPEGNQWSFGSYLPELPA
ncbi:MAG: VOC family protein [Solirubrobacteraceae bacterium]|nr:VOC family protein [Patulibacter sp.]